VSVDGPMGVLIQLGFVLCTLGLLVMLIIQFRRSGKD
jgi:uncharacterized membrane protein